MWNPRSQRVPLRFCFDPNESTDGLRAGMSAVVAVDTGRTRTLAGLLLSPLAWLESWFAAPSAATATAR